jgi:acetylornithine deacetylase/succinyl-diaminopimelate desuccinylase-like protein
VFLYFYKQENLAYNLVFAATAEEEISGKNGIEALLAELPKLDCGIVGEPTLMQMAVAERGLLVLDVTATGKAGHAAREEVRMHCTKRLPILSGSVIMNLKKFPHCLVKLKCRLR